jgi:hypothetical protein
MLLQGTVPRARLLARGLLAGALRPDTVARMAVPIAPPPRVGEAPYGSMMLLRMA